MERSRKVSSRRLFPVHSMNEKILLISDKAIKKRREEKGKGGLSKVCTKANSVRSSAAGHLIRLMRNCLHKTMPGQGHVSAHLPSSSSSSPSYFSLPPNCTA